jgi:hypothetical protein
VIAAAVFFLSRETKLKPDERRAPDFSEWRREVRSPEALERRREERLDRNPFAKPPRPLIVSVVPSAPKPPPPPDDLLHDAELLLDTAARVRGDTFTDEVRLRLKVSFDVAAGLVRELVSQGRLVRNVADNGFVTLTRPSGRSGTPLGQGGIGHA